MTLPGAPRPPADPKVLGICGEFPGCGERGFTAAGPPCVTVGCRGSANGLSLEEVRGGGKLEADLEDGQHLLVEVK